MPAWDAVVHAVDGNPGPLLSLEGAARTRAGAFLRFLVRHEVAVRLGRRASLADVEDLATPDTRGVLLMAFGFSDPTTEVRGDAYLLAAAQCLRDLGTSDLQDLRAAADAAVPQRER